jgi:hypothetical protein
MSEEPRSPKPHLNVVVPVELRRRLDIARGDVSIQRFTVRALEAAVKVVAPPDSEMLVFENGGWTHRLEPEGHRWRWRATFNHEVHDFGLIPGGAYVAVEKLVQQSGARVMPEGVDQ